MAVVFISPKQRQKMFFVGITIVFLLVLIVISFGVFLAKPTEVSPVLVFNKPKVNIDMKVFNSDQFKKLQPFTEMQMQYSYQGTTSDGKSQSGFITATSIDEARTMLTSMGLTIIQLQEAEVGRDDPFTPYYQQVVTPSTTKTTKTTTTAKK